MHGADFSRLRTFVAVAERGSFVKASAALGVSTSTVSQTVRLLEDRLCVRLLNRTTRAVALTEAGEQLLRRVEPLLRELDNALESLNAFRDQPQGTLRLSVSSLALSLLVTPKVRPFLEAYPGIRLELTVDDSSGDLVDGRTDAGLRALGRIPQDMIAVKVSSRSRVMAFAAPAYLARHGAPQFPDDLIRHNCVQFRFASGALYPWTFQLDGGDIQPAVSGSLVTDNADLLLKAAIDGVGISYTTETHAEEAVREGRLAPVLEPYAIPFDGWFIYYPSRRQIPTPLRLFIAALTRDAAAARAA